MTEEELKKQAEAAKDAAKKAQQARAKKYGISIRNDGNMTKPDEYSDISDSDFADPVNYAYPIDEDHIRAALRYWGKQKNKDKYSEEDQAVIDKRINASAKKFKVGEFAEITDDGQQNGEKIPEAQMLSRVARSLEKAVRDSYGWSAYICDWDKKYVYFAKEYSEQARWQQEYSYDEKAMSVSLLGTAQKAEIVYKKVKEAVAIKFCEAKEKTGLVWKVVLIKAGMSANGVYYPPDVLREAVPVFEGTKSFLRTDDEHIDDTNKSVESWTGTFKNVSFSESSQAIVADFHLLKTEERLIEKLKAAEEQGLLESIGLSIVAWGDTKVKKDAKTGKTYREAVKLVKAVSVDPVSEPAAGGRFLKMAAAKQKEELDMKVTEKLLEAIKPHADLYSQIDLENIDESKVLELYSEAVKRGQKEPEKKPDGVSLEDFQKLQEAIKISDCTRILEQKLAESKLSEPSKSRVRDQFNGKVFVENKLTEAIAAELEYLGKLVEGKHLDGITKDVKAGDGEREKTLKAFDGLIAGKDQDGIPRFRSFREAYVTITGDANLTGQLREAKNLHRFTESLTTSSWAELLGDSITRRMVSEYNMPSLQEWRKIVSDITAPKDFRTNRRMRMGGYGSLPTVAEAGTYQALTSPGDEEATYAVGKKGGTEDVTLEMIANDDVGAIRRIPTKLARAAANTLYRAIFDIIVNNAAIYDSVALFHANHSNLGATALSATTLNAARKSMGQQAAYGASTEVLGLNAKYVLVPYDLEDTAFRLVNSPSVVGATNNAGTEPNIHSTYGLDVMLIPYWTDTNDWALVCDPADCPTIEVGFFNGQEEPELFVQDTPTAGSLFSADKITYKIRHIYGVCVLDYRGFYKAVVA